MPLSIDASDELQSLFFQILDRYENCARLPRHDLLFDRDFLNHRYNRTQLRDYYGFTNDMIFGISLEMEFTVRTEFERDNHRDSLGRGRWWNSRQLDILLSRIYDERYHPQARTEPAYSKYTHHHRCKVKLCHAVWHCTGQSCRDIIYLHRKTCPSCWMAGFEKRQQKSAERLAQSLRNACTAPPPASVMSVLTTPLTAQQRHWFTGLTDQTIRQTAAWESSQTMYVATNVSTDSETNNSGGTGSVS